MLANDDNNGYYDITLAITINKPPGESSVQVQIINGEGTVIYDQPFVFSDTSTEEVLTETFCGTLDYLEHLQVHVSTTGGSGSESSSQDSSSSEDGNDGDSDSDSEEGNDGDSNEDSSGDESTTLGVSVEKVS